jgi:hypothetical protein
MPSPNAVITITKLAVGCPVPLSTALIRLEWRFYPAACASALSAAKRKFARPASGPRPVFHNAARRFAYLIRCSWADLDSGLRAMRSPRAVQRCQAHRTAWRRRKAHGPNRCASGELPEGALCQRPQPVQGGLRAAAPVGGPHGLARKSRRIARGSRLRHAVGLTSLRHDHRHLDLDRHP